MTSREKLLAAAARIYGAAGFRGATTRRIAEEAGVNEVTLFRLFGSKAALIDEALRENASMQEPESVALPEQPVDPERELTQWCAAQLTHLRAGRSLIRKTMGELEERPEVVPCMSRGPIGAFDELRAYAVALGRMRGTATERESATAATMLLGSLFADAMGREVMPTVFPQPPTQAPALYTRVFLRALGCEQAATSGTAHDDVHRRTSE